MEPDFKDDARGGAGNDGGLLLVLVVLASLAAQVTVAIALFG